MSASAERGGGKIGFFLGESVCTDFDVVPPVCNPVATGPFEGYAEQIRKKFAQLVLPLIGRIASHLKVNGEASKCSVRFDMHLVDVIPKFGGPVEPIELFA